MTRRDQPPIGFGTAESKLARGPFQRRAAVQAFTFERGHTRRNICFGTLFDTLNANYVTVYDEYHLTARRRLALKMLGKLAQRPAHHLFMELGQFSGNHGFALA